MVPGEIFLNEKCVSMCHANLPDSPLPTVRTSTSDCHDNIISKVLVFLLVGRQGKVLREICYIHPTESGLGMFSFMFCQHTLRHAFLDGMCQ